MREAGAEPDAAMNNQIRQAEANEAAGERWRRGLPELHRPATNADMKAGRKIYYRRRGKKSPRNLLASWRKRGAGDMTSLKHQGYEYITPVEDDDTEWPDVMGVAPQPDPVNPPHYQAHPSGIECIQIAEHFNFCLGNAIKYIWRADQKDRTIEGLRKARWYIDREIARREGEE